MNAAKSLATCICRRRVLTSRLCSALVQLLLVLLIWWILKSQTPTAAVDYKRYTDQSNDFNSELSNAKVHHYLDLSLILSRSRAVRPVSESAPKHYLGVDVYIRDGETGQFTVYPQDTPINFDNLTTRGQGEGRNDDEIEYSDNYKASEDYLPDHLDDYDASLHKDELDDTFNMADKGKMIFPAKSDNLAYKDKEMFAAKDETMATSGKGVITAEDESFLKIASNSHSRGEGTGSNESQASVGVGKPNTSAKPLLQSQIFGHSSKEQAQLFGHDKLSPVSNPEFVSDETQQPPADRVQQTNTFHQEIQSQKLNISSPSILPSFFQKIFNQNPSFSQGLATAQQATQELDQNVQQTAANGAQIRDNQLDNFKPSSDVQHPKIPDSTNEFSVLKSVGHIYGTFNPGMTAGFLERVNNFMFELDGKVVDNNSNNFTAPTALLLNNPQACKSGPSEVYLLYLINSKPQSSDMRQRIRDTFVKKTYFLPVVIAHVFLVGTTTSPNFQNSLNQEHDFYGDVVQGSFVDAPGNATEKGLMGMRWVGEYCPQANYIMTINEDVFVDTDKLIRGLIPVTKRIPSPKIMLCFFNPEGPIPRSGPNAFSGNLFPGRLNLRPYCKGFAVLVTRGVISSLVAASKFVRHIRMDDFYLYGVLPYIAGGVDVYDLGNKRAFHNFGMEVVNCYQQKLDRCPYVASVAFSERFTTLWELVKTRMAGSHGGWEGDQSLWDIQSYAKTF